MDLSCHSYMLVTNKKLLIHIPNPVHVDSIDVSKRIERVKFMLQSTNQNLTHTVNRKSTHPSSVK